MGELVSLQHRMQLVTVINCILDVLMFQGLMVLLRYVLDTLCQTSNWDQWSFCVSRTCGLRGSPRVVPLRVVPLQPHACPTHDVCTSRLSRARLDHHFLILHLKLNKSSPDRCTTQCPRYEEYPVKHPKLLQSKTVDHWKHAHSKHVDTERTR